MAAGIAANPLGDLFEELAERVHELVRAEVAAQVPQSRLVSKEKLAELLGVKERTIKTMRSKGLPGYRVGKEVFYDIAEAEKWIEREAE